MIVRKPRFQEGACGQKNASEFKKISELLKRSKSEFIWDIYFKSVFSIKDSLSDVDKELLEIGINRFPKFKKLDFLNKTKDKLKLKNVRVLKTKINEKNTSKAIQRYAQAVTLQGVPVLKTEPSFASDPQVLIDQLKFIIDSNPNLTAE